MVRVISWRTKQILHVEIIETTEISEPAERSQLAQRAQQGRGIGKRLELARHILRF